MHSHIVSIQGDLPRQSIGPRFQRGTAAIEFAMVCSLFLLVLYFIVSYGAVFIVQQSLSRAAAEGARALLASEFTTSGTGTVTSSALVPPEQLGRDAASRAVAWLSAYRQTRSQPPILPTVSRQPSCTTNMACRTVTVQYPNYRTYPLVAALLPAAMPQHLSASATVQLDTALWLRAGGSP